MVMVLNMIMTMTEAVIAKMMAVMTMMAMTMTGMMIILCISVRGSGSMGLSLHPVVVPPTLVGRPGVGRGLAGVHWPPASLVR